MGKLTTADKWNNTIGIIQTGILIVATIVAGVIGYYQIKINDQLLVLTSYPSIQIHHYKSWIKVTNRGNTNIEYWGYQYEDDEPDFREDGPAVIAVGMSVKIPINEKTQNIILNQVEKQIKKDMHYKYLFKRSDGTEYVAKILFIHTVESGEYEVLTQMLGLYQHDWTKEYLENPK